MLDISATHPFEACAAFAARFLAALAEYDLVAAEALLDANDSDSPLAESLPAPEGFTYAHPDRVVSWTMHVLNADAGGLSCEFELPFGEEEYRPMMARFEMRRVGDRLEVRFRGVVPT